MDLNFKWFALDEEKTDLDNVTQFLEDLPKNIEKLIDPNNSNIYEILKKNKVEISEDLIQNAFKEAEKEYKSSLLNFGYKKRISKSTGTNLIENLGKDLIKIGFSENSLILKAKVLNQLWDQVIRYLESIGSGILRFSDFKLTVLTLSFLNYLNSILDSLGKIMGLETIKEFKDVIEGIININQNINLVKK